MRTLLLVFAVAACAGAPPQTPAPSPATPASIGTVPTMTGGITTPPPGPANTVGLGERMALGHGVTVVPLRIIEDSRCPINARCIQAGQLVVRVAVERPGGVLEKTATLGTTTLLPGGTLAFDWATERIAGEAPRPLRLAFSYAPDIAR